MIAAGGSPTPPTPTVIPYIRGGADGSYIDTGITPDDTTKIIVWARNFNPGSGELFGSTTSASADKFCLSAPSGANTGGIQIQYGDATDVFVGDQFSRLSHYRKYEYYQGVLKIDNATVANTATQPTFNGTNNIRLFGSNNAGTGQDMNFPVDICACQIYKGGTLVRDYTPVDSPSVGLYDAVSETVFTNAGGGAFSYGSFNSNAYTPLEYIRGAGSSYFDSGVYGTYYLPIVFAFVPTNSTASWRDLLGERISSPANSCDIATGTATSGSDNTRLYWRFGASTTSSTAFSGSSSNKLTNKKVVCVKDNATLFVYNENTQIGSATKGSVPTSFTTTYTMGVGSIITGNGVFSNDAIVGRIYFAGFGSEKNFVPAKVGADVGMYDTYNDVFKPSISGTDFTAGPAI